jgi:hypothetical protein
LLEPSEEERLAYADVASALDVKRSHFGALALARMLSPQAPRYRVLVEDDPEAAREVGATMQRFFPGLVKAFEHRFGEAHYHWCDWAPAAAVHTVRRRALRTESHLWLVFNPTRGWPAGEDTLYGCDALTKDIEDVLRGGGRHRMLQQVFEIITGGLATLDADARATYVRTTDRPATHEQARQATDADSEQFASRLGGARQTFERAAKRTMQLLYLAGMVTGALGIAGLGLATLALADTALLRQAGFDSPESRRAIVCVLAGIAGAVFSVLLRLDDNKGVEVDRAVGRTIGFILGASRAAIGAMSGAVLYLALASGSLPLATDDPARFGTLYALLAFAAGFSERKVPDMLGLQRLGGSPT